MARLRPFCPSGSCAYILSVQPFDQASASALAFRMPKEGAVRIFGREPAAWLHALQAVLAFFVTLPALNSLGFTEEVSGYVMTVAAGVVALLVAFATRPVVPAALTGAVQTILTGLIAFGLPLSEVSSAALVAALNVVLMLLMPLGLTPAASPDPKFTRANTSRLAA